MSERKNIFLIGRRNNKGKEDQLTEMLAYLWQESETALASCLGFFGAGHRGEIEVDTQFTIPSRKRPDIAIRSEGAVTLVESKLDSGFHDAQVTEYLEHLASQEGARTLVLLTKKPEQPEPADVDRAQRLGVKLVAKRWHDIGRAIASETAETLDGDFVRFLIREDLVKPDPFSPADWEKWNAGYGVLLRVETLMNEVGAHVGRLIPGAARKGQPGVSKRWLWFTWGTAQLDIGLGFAASRGGSDASGPAQIFAFVRNYSTSDEMATAAVGQTAATRGKWAMLAGTDTTCGLHYNSPAWARPCDAVVNAPLFEDQVEQALAFMDETLDYFRGRGYMPAV